MPSLSQVSGVPGWCVEGHGFNAHSDFFFLLNLWYGEYYICLNNILVVQVGTPPPSFHIVRSNWKEIYWLNATLVLVPNNIYGDISVFSCFYFPWSKHPKSSSHTLLSNYFLDHCRAKEQLPTEGHYAFKGRQSPKISQPQTGFMKPSYDES